VGLMLLSVSSSYSSDSEVFLYDGTSVSQLTDNRHTDSRPQLADNGYVVWQGCDGGTGRYCMGGDREILLYDGTSTTQITNNDYDDLVPDISNNGYVVWSGCDTTDCDWEGDGDLEIFLYDGTSTTQITNNDYDDFEPEMNNNGYVVWSGGDTNGYVVWSGCGTTDCDWEGHGDLEIFLYDGTSTTQITDDDYNHAPPQINDNGWVVWSGWDGRRDKIFLYDGTSTTQIGEGSGPQINNNGWVLWRDWYGLDKGLFLYDGTTTTRLKRNLFWPWGWGPQINDIGHVVWPHVRCLHGWGWPYSCRAGSSAIFLYDGTNTTRLGKTDIGVISSSPRINNNGWVVWSAETTLCFIATAAFGTELDGKIDVLRSFRDRYLVDNAVGQGFLSAYYRYSPPVADYIAQHRWLKAVVRTLLLPVIGLVSLFV